jgi:hypothetical protein
MLWLGTENVLSKQFVQRRFGWHNTLLHEASLVLRHFHVYLNNLVIISQHTSQPFCKPNISGVISTDLNTICQPVSCRFTQPYKIVEILPNSQPQWCK